MKRLLSVTAEKVGSQEKRIKRRYQKKKHAPHISTVRWVDWERITFLRGLSKYGKGKWKEIAKAIPTRTTIQVKTHAQMILKRMNAGEDIFAPLICPIEKATKDSWTSDDDKTVDTCYSTQSELQVESNIMKCLVPAWKPAYNTPTSLLNTDVETIAARILLTLSSKKTEYYSGEGMQKDMKTEN